MLKVRVSERIWVFGSRCSLESNSAEHTAWTSGKNEGNDNIFKGSTCEAIMMMMTVVLLLLEERLL